MINQIYALSKLTFKQAIRNKILYAIAFFVIFTFLFSLVLGELSLDEQQRVIKDVGMLFIALMASALALYTSISSFHNELSTKTIYTVLSKPVPRYRVILGKFFGIATALFVEIAAMASIFIAMLLILQHPVNATLCIGVLFIYLQALMLAAFCLFFATFTSLVLNTLLALSFFILANLHDAITVYADDQTSKLVVASMNAANFLLPNLSLFNISTQITYNIPIPPAYTALCIIHAAAFITLILTLASLIFKRRDFI